LCGGRAIIIHDEPHSSFRDILRLPTRDTLGIPRRVRRYDRGILGRTIDFMAKLVIDVAKFNVGDLFGGRATPE
jgi:hypothetical protein